ncbi:MAG: endolytic transglycosylase MltG [Patescibacteria group bacterium]
MFSKPIRRIFTISIIIIIVGIFISVGYNIIAYYFITPSGSPEGSYELVVASGDSVETVADALAEDEVIPSENSLLLQARLNSFNTIQQGNYTLELPDSPEGVMLQIRSQSNDISQKLAELNSKPEVKITFKEGETLDQMIDKLAEKKVASKEDLESLANQHEVYDISKYPFLPEPLSCDYGDIGSCAKYYLEGYLYPDTYNFTESMDPKQVFQTFLNNFNNKVWSKIEDQITREGFYDVVTLASVLEKETGRTKGVTAETKDELSQERKIMAGVFYNRLEQDMKWQSDVTAEYGTGKKLCQQTFEVENCMLLDSPLAKTMYNTYQNVGFPIGPITSPQVDNIQATLNPDENNYLFFVSDVTGKKYFAETADEHFQVIREVNIINNELS